MSCTRRGFLKTIAGAMVGLGLTRLEPLRSFAAGSTTSTGTAELGGPATGPFSIDSLRAQAVQAARWAGDAPLADELQEVCCWAPAATALRKRPLEMQTKSVARFFSSFPGGDQLASVLVHTNNTSFQKWFNRLEDIFRFTVLIVTELICLTLWSFQLLLNI